MKDGQRKNRYRVGSLLLVCALLPGLGCVTVAEHRKLEARVIDLQRQGPNTDSLSRLAEVTAEIDSLRAELREVQGRLEVAERASSNALSEAGKARRQAATTSAGAGLAGAGAGNAPDLGSDATEGAAPSAEVTQYRDAYTAWRENDAEACIDRFRKFLQTYPSSSYADDAAFWMADCHFKQGDFKNAVLRFDDVVRNYPAGDKAPDALYRQGESLLKLGPGYHPAAKRAFERVLKEYPESSRAEESERQLQLLTS